MAMNQTNIGKTVLVEEYIGRFNAGDTFNYRGVECKAIINDHYWWICADYGLKNFSGVEAPKAYIADSWLEPIRPTNIEETEKEDIELDA